MFQVKTLNYLEDNERIRPKRNNIRHSKYAYLQFYSNFSASPFKLLIPLKYLCIHTFLALDCPKSGKIVDKVHGFAQLTENNYSVHFIYDNGKHFVKIRWEAPTGT